MYIFQTESKAHWTRTYALPRIMEYTALATTTLKDNLLPLDSWTYLPDEAVQCALMLPEDSKLHMVIHNSLSITNDIYENFPGDDQTKPEFWVDADDKPNIHFIEIPVNAKILNKIDAYCKDDKAISMALMENIRHKVRVYRQKNTIQVYTNKLTATLIRKVIVLLPKLFPNENITPIKDDILSAFVKDGPTGTDYAIWYEATLELLKTSTFIARFKIKNLTEAINKRTEQQIQNARNEYDAAQRDIQSYENSITTLYQKMLRASTLISGLEQTAEMSGSDLYHYLIKNKAIDYWNTRISTDGAILDLRFVTPLEYFDDTLVKRYLQSEKTFIYKTGMPKDVTKQLVTDLFVTGTKKLICQTPLRINLTQNSMAINSIQDYDYCPQPHLVGFNCWGDGKTRILRLLKEQNYIGAIEQIITSCKNLNTSDSVVFDHLMRNLASRKAYKWITTENGEQKSIQEIYMNEKDDDDDEDN